MEASQTLSKFSDKIPHDPEIEIIVPSDEGENEINNNETTAKHVKLELPDVRLVKSVNPQGDTLKSLLEEDVAVTKLVKVVSPTVFSSVDKIVYPAPLAETVVDLDTEPNDDQNVSGELSDNDSNRSLGSPSKITLPSLSEMPEFRNLPREDDDMRNTVSDMHHEVIKVEMPTTIQEAASRGVQQLPQVEQATIPNASSIQQAFTGPGGIPVGVIEPPVRHSHQPGLPIRHSQDLQHSQQPFTGPIETGHSQLPFNTRATSVQSQPSILQNQQPYNGPPTQQHYTGPPTQQPYTGPPAQQPYTGPPAQQPYTGPSTQQQHTGPPAQQLYLESPIRQTYLSKFPQPVLPRHKPGDEAAVLAAYQKGPPYTRIVTPALFPPVPPPIPFIKRRRVQERMRLSADQRNELEAVYKSKEYPSSEFMTAFERKYNVPMRKIRGWFQNRRARERRHLLKQKQRGIEPMPRPLLLPPATISYQELKNSYIYNPAGFHQYYPPILPGPPMFYPPRGIYPQSYLTAKRNKAFTTTSPGYSLYPGNIKTAAMMESSPSPQEPDSTNNCDNNNNNATSNNNHPQFDPIYTIAKETGVIDGMYGTQTSAAGYQDKFHHTQQSYYNTSYNQWQDSSYNYNQTAPPVSSNRTVYFDDPNAFVLDLSIKPKVTEIKLKKIKTSTNVVSAQQDINNNDKIYDPASMLPGIQKLVPPNQDSTIIRTSTPRKLQSPNVEAVPPTEARIKEHFVSLQEYERNQNYYYSMDEGDLSRPVTPTPTSYPAHWSELSSHTPTPWSVSKSSIYDPPMSVAHQSESSSTPVASWSASGQYPPISWSGPSYPAASWTGSSSYPTASIMSASYTHPAATWAGSSGSAFIPYYSNRPVTTPTIPPAETDLGFETPPHYLESDSADYPSYDAYSEKVLNTPPSVASRQSTDAGDSYTEKMLNITDDGSDLTMGTDEVEEVKIVVKNEQLEF